VGDRHTTTSPARLFPSVLYEALINQGVPHALSAQGGQSNAKPLGVFSVLGLESDSESAGSKRRAGEVTTRTGGHGKPLILPTPYRCFLSPWTPRSGKFCSGGLRQSVWGSASTGRYSINQAPIDTAVVDDLSASPSEVKPTSTIPINWESTGPRGPSRRPQLGKPCPRTVQL
jgi:hypothetical protein